MKKILLTIVALIIIVPTSFVISIIAFPQWYFEGEELKEFQESVAVMKEEPVLFFGALIKIYITGFCTEPRNYSITTIDSRFKISKETVTALLKEAETLWEDAAGIDLFNYQESEGDISVEFIYDDRQKSTFDLQDFNRRSVTHETRVADLDRRFDAFSRKIDIWNENPGTEDERARLEAEGNALEQEQVLVNNNADQLNLERDILNAHADALGEEYQSGFFSYGDNKLTIHQYDNVNHLKVLLAHEFGHAISIDHIDNPESVMYYLLSEDGVIRDFKLSDDDKTALNRVCKL